MTLKKKINGQEVELTTEEEAALITKWEVNAAPPTSKELDALADQVAEQTLESNKQMKALGLVMADLIEQIFGVSQSVARQQVKTRFRDYYRSLL